MLKRFFKEEEGLATLEIVLILVILIGLVVIFKDTIKAFFQRIMNKITSGSEDILNTDMGGN
ncbi:Flp1 family type IVb pilin [Clostridium chrysemydis]|uniref:Flp1 family type IVb pilin n=1 Tax=Clostridium chrysemydis TaxID=2665504 RepID=UPI0018844289